jgi:hypothetical protein
VPPPPPNASPQWTVVVAADDTRTLSQAKLLELYQKGDVTDATLVWRDGMAEWLPVSGVPELAALVKPVAEIEEDGATTMYRAASVPPPPPAPSPPQPSAPAMAPPPPPAPMRPAQPSYPDQGQSSPFSQQPQAPFSQQPQAPFSQQPQAPFSQQPQAPFSQQPQAPFSQQPGGFNQAPPMGRNAPTMPMLPAPQLDASGRPLVREASIIGLPTQAFMAQVGGGRRKKKLFLVAGLVVAAAIGGGVFAARTLDARDRAASEESFSKLTACLIGTAPTGKETAASKFRNIQLAVMGTPVEKRAKGSEQPWPGRCAPIAHELSEAAKGLSGKEALVDSAEALAKAIVGDPASTGSFKDILDKVWAAAASANLTPVAAPGVPAPPAAATPMSDEQLRDLPRLLGGNFTLSSVRNEAFVGSAARFLIDQRDLSGGPQFCTVTALDSAVSCKKVGSAAAKLSPGLRLGGTADDGADPLVFAGDRGQLGTFRGEDPFGDGFVVSSSARKEGPGFVLTRTSTRDLKLLVKAAGKPITERPLLTANDVGNPTVTVGLFWDWLAYRSGAKATPASHLLFRKLSDAGEPGPAFDVGELDDVTPGDEANVDPRQAAKQTETDDERQMVGCRTADATMVRLRGTKQDYVSFFQAGKWSPVAKSPSKGGTFSCHATEATSTRVAPKMEQERNFATIHETKCSLSGCTEATVSVRDLVGGLLDAAPVDVKAVQAVTIEGKLLVVWNAGYNGGLRMRLAPIATIRDGLDTVIADQRDEKSALKLATVTDIRLVAAKQFAILFLATPAGTKLVKIDGTGKLTPLSSTN